MTVLARTLVVASIVCALAAAACGSGGSTKTATGIVFDVESSSLTKLDGFSLQTDDNQTLVFGVAPEADRQDPQNGFVPGHLREHALTATRVQIDYREDGDELLALRIEDVLS
jgi:hypothetical protein